MIENVSQIEPRKWCVCVTNLDMCCSISLALSKYFFLLAAPATAGKIDVSGAHHNEPVKCVYLRLLGSMCFPLKGLLLTKINHVVLPGYPMLLMTLSPDP